MAEQIDHLVKMANQIARNVGAQSDLDTAAAKTSDHLRRFWTPAMRQRLAAYGRAGGEGLSPAVMRMLELDGEAASAAGPGAGAPGKNAGPPG